MGCVGAQFNGGIGRESAVFASPFPEQVPTGRLTTITRAQIAKNIKEQPNLSTIDSKRLVAL